MLPRRRIARVALALLVSLLAAEVTLRAVLDEGRLAGRPLPPFGATPHPRQRAFAAAWRGALERGETLPFDAELGWVPRPHDPGERPGDVFGPLGARGPREYGPAPGKGVLRVAAFGDSFVYGSEVADGEDWCARLEADDPALEVLNFGVGAYGTDQALLRFRREGLHGARVAVLGLLVENIGRNVNRYRPLYYTRSYNAAVKPRFALEDGGLVPVPVPFADAGALLDAIEDGSVLARTAAHEHWADDATPVPGLALARVWAGWGAYRRRQPERLWADTDGEPFRVTLAIVEAFHAEALAAGAERALVLVFPREQELRHLAGGGGRFWGTLETALEARGVPTLDLSRELLEPWRAGDVGYVQGHLDPAANELVARRVHAWLRP